MSAIDVPKITRDVDQETLAKVISGAVTESDIRS
jgi:flagellar motor switch protein FliG